MRVFITGASGWIGSAVTPAVIARGHQVVGLARSEDSAARLRSIGADVLEGGLDDLDVLRRGAGESDGVIHLANKHDYSDPAEMNRAERSAVETMLAALEGTGRPFLLASGTALIGPGSFVTEDQPNPVSGPDAMRGGTEALAMDFAAKGVRSVALRFAPTVHGRGDHGFVRMIADGAKRAGAVGYVGDGGNRWSAVNVADAGSLVALALERSEPGSAVHAVGEEAVTGRAIAEAIGRRLGLPTESITAEESNRRAVFAGRFFGLDIPASSALTRARLGWEPTHQGIIADIEAGYYTD